MMMVRLYHECCPRRCCRCRCRGRLSWPCYCLHTIGTRWSTRNATAGSPERVVPPQQRKRSGAVGDKISDPFYMAIEHQKSSETSILGFSPADRSSPTTVIMPKSVEKTRKRISKKKGDITVLHENSRDSQHLRRAQMRDDKLLRVASARRKTDQPLRMSFATTCLDDAG